MGVKKEQKGSLKQNNNKNLGSNERIKRANGVQGELWKL